MSACPGFFACAVRRTILERFPAGDPRGSLAAEEFAAALIPVYPSAQGLPSWSISRCVRQVLDTWDGAEDPLPEALRAVISTRDLPALHALQQLRPVLAQTSWGVSGSAGFELATGIEALHAESDLDLILRAPEPLDRNDARALLERLDKAVCSVDLQLQTPFGAVALREWAGPSRRVLLKTTSGAHLVIDPWQVVA